jgi:flagellar motility protein MotE (MotC chaperone)
MSKVKELKEQKITEKQLEHLQGLANATNQGYVALGQLDAQKHEVLKQLDTVNGEMRTLQKELEEEYGKVTVNIQDGSIKEIEVETQDGDNS